MTTSQDTAKQFLVDRVVAQASREGVALTPVEISMLGFCELTATPEEKEASAAFERDYNHDEYEAKVTLLVHDAYENDVAAGMKDQWDVSLDTLAEEDIYLFVMLENAGIVKTTTKLVMPDWRMLVGLVPALICIGLAVLVITPLAARVVPNGYLRLGICVLFLLAPFILSKLNRRRP